jgi:REP element-mobilizing transposase RayT
MPRKSLIRSELLPYHVTNRCNNREPFRLPTEDVWRICENRLYEITYLFQARIHAFVLMPNHFHLLLFQKEQYSISELMRSVMTSYVGYINKKYQRSGHLFQDVFKAARIDEDGYWQHISRYIHLNPREWQTWEWSSLPYYDGRSQADWVRPEMVLRMFTDDSYRKFLEDYRDYTDSLDELEFILANNLHED